MKCFQYSIILKTHQAMHTFSLSTIKNKKSSILFLLKRHLERDIRRQKITYVACVACHIDRIRKDCKNVVLCQSCCYATVSEFLYSFFIILRCTLSQIISRCKMDTNYEYQIKDSYGDF